MLTTAVHCRERIHHNRIHLEKTGGVYKKAAYRPLVPSLPWEGTHPACLPPAEKNAVTCCHFSGFYCRTGRGGSLCPAATKILDSGGKAGIQPTSHYLNSLCTVNHAYSLENGERTLKASPQMPAEGPPRQPS